MKHTLTLALASSLLLALPVLAADEAIKASDEKALKAAVGKPVIITGTVESIAADDKKKPVEIRFVDSKLRIFVTAAKYWKTGGWGLEAYTDETLFIKGKIAAATDGDGLEIGVESESHIHERLDSLIAGLPKSDGKPTTKPAPGADPKAEEKEFKPVSAGAIFPKGFGSEDLEPKIKYASLKAIVPKFGGTTPEMVFTTVSAEITFEANSGPMQAAFDLTPKLKTKGMTDVMTYLPKKWKDKGWPQNMYAQFLIDEVQADSAPPNLVAAVLIDSMLAGIKLPKNLLVFGGMTADGKLSSTADKERSTAAFVTLIEAAASGALPQYDEEEEDEDDKDEDAPPKPNKTIYLITSEVPDGTLDDFIIDKAWDVVNSVIILECSTFEEVMKMVKEISTGGPIGKTVTDLAEAQALMRKRSIGLLNDKAVWARVVAAGRAYPGNATAFAYARIRTRQIPKTYSLDRCISRIHRPIDKSTSSIDLTKFEDRELRKYLRDLETDLGSIAKRIHPDTAPLYEAAEVYLKQIGDRASAINKLRDREKDAAKKRDIKKAPERIETKYEEAKKSYEELRAAARKQLTEGA